MKVRVEAIVRESCSTPFDVIREEVQDVVMVGKTCNFQNGFVDISSSSLLQASCKSVGIVDAEENEGLISDGNSDKKMKIDVKVFKVFTNKVGYVDFFRYNKATEGGENNASLPTKDLVSTLNLPHVSLQHVWHSLRMKHPIKKRLLSYATSLLFFARKQVSPHVVDWNRIILLHGETGNGKTSLCQAFSNRLAIDIIDHQSSTSSSLQNTVYKNSVLLSLDSHSLFGRFSSDSKSMVTNFFDNLERFVREKERDDKTQVCLLIDNVESLAICRSSSATNHHEQQHPDTVRTVNAFLAGMDRLRYRSNLLVMATTNHVESVDDAFLDRVDLESHVGPPDTEARHDVLKACVDELLRVGVVVRTDASGSGSGGGCIRTLTSALHASPLLSSRALARLRRSELNKRAFSPSLQLRKCAELAEGLSGRTLRRIPFQSHAMFLSSSSLSSSSGSREQVTIHTFLDALIKGIQHEQQSRGLLKKKCEGKM